MEGRLRGQGWPRNPQSEQRGLPYRWENKGRSSGWPAAGQLHGRSLPGRCSGRGSPEGVKAARGRSEVRPAGAVGRERRGAGEGAAGGQITGPHVSPQERPWTSTLCLHGVRSKKPTPDAPYRPRSSASRRAYIKGAAGRLPAGGTREATRSQVRGGPADQRGQGLLTPRLTLPGRRSWAPVHVRAGCVTGTPRARPLWQAARGARSAGTADPPALREESCTAAWATALLFSLSPQRGGPPARQTMLPKAALLLSLLATLPVSPAELARSGFWEYLSQLTSDKDSPEHGQSSKLGRDVANQKESVGDGAGYVGDFLEKLAPLDRGLQPRLYHDSDSLRKLIRKELESLRVKLSPYVDEVHHKVGKHLEDLRYRLQPFTEELLDQVSLKARELRRQLTPSREATARLLGGAEEVQRFVAHYADKIAFHADQVKDIFRPYSERLVTEIHRNVEELHRNVVPHAQASPEQLNRCIQELSAKLTRKARDLHQKIQRNLEQLKAKLSLRPGGPRQPPAPADRYAQELAREVQRRVEEFRRETHLQIQDFTRALDQETEEMRLKLSSRPAAPGGPQEGPPALEDLHARLDALWRDLALSLGERGGEAR
ncbi:LOW QUALITY PROTEIN: apolipoprotein A-V [Theristicus caerulescens]